MLAGLGHIAVGLAGARLLRGPRGVGTGFATAALVLCGLSMAPDLDVIAFALGIPYEAEFGHRGASHALLAAVAVALVCAALPPREGRSRARLSLVVLGVVASHGLLDTMTDGGLGIALLWPFDNARYFAPWRPIPVSPIGPGLLSWRGGYVVGVELVMFAPVWVWALMPRRDTWRDAAD